METEFQAEGTDCLLIFIKYTNTWPVVGNRENLWSCQEQERSLCLWSLWSGEETEKSGSWVCRAEATTSLGSVFPPLFSLSRAVMDYGLGYEAPLGQFFSRQTTATLSPCSLNICPFSTVLTALFQLKLIISETSVCKRLLTSFLASSLLFPLISSVRGCQVNLPEISFTPCNFFSSKLLLASWYWQGSSVPGALHFSHFSPFPYPTVDNDSSWRSAGCSRNGNFFGWHPAAFEASSLAILLYFHFCPTLPSGPGMLESSLFLKHSLALCPREGQGQMNKSVGSRVTHTSPKSQLCRLTGTLSISYLSFLSLSFFLC